MEIGYGKVIFIGFLLLIITSFYFFPVTTKETFNVVGHGVWTGAKGTYNYITGNEHVQEGYKDIRENLSSELAFNFTNKSKS